MPTIYLEFKNQPKLILDIDDTTVGWQYFNLVKNQYTEGMPIFRDKINYTLEYFDYLVKMANKKLNTNWHFEIYDLPTTVLIHKTIEQLIGVKTTGFSNVSSEFDDLLHELHYCLHEIQHSKINHNQRTGFMQVEWFTDNGIPLDENFTFNQKIELGDLRLQNPYVGHGPHRIYLDNDHTNIFQTCRFHDLIRPGIVICLSSFDHSFISSQEYKEYFSTNAPDFVNYHGMETIMKYSGHPVIGKVRNIDDLIKIKQAIPLEFESLQFE